ncbi:response regulator [Synechococcus sp. PCC 7336]|uniref:response regulator n=1 Tax=Synechococcus sp. PCC 7336 TaxID=195250 RepID=UPI00034AD275|nr:response regulator [Synechococcus sp. PCC 7336]
MRILLIDDDLALIDALTLSLTELHYTVDAVTDGEAGWSYGSTLDYDLIVLDWMLPKIDGISLCRRLRAKGCLVPILLITARSSSPDKVIGLDAGADDYVIKPFDFEELVARIRALLRRTHANPELIFSWENLKLDPRSCEVTYNDELVSLTAKEYALLELFLRRRQHIFSISSIIDNLWPSESCPADATVRSHLRGLRRKLRESGAPSDTIETVNGIGYRLKAPPKVNRTTTPFLLDLPRKSESRQKHFEALATVWQKHKATNLKYLTRLEQLLSAPLKKPIHDKYWDEARSIAHTLAGTLGTFGFAEGSRLARELESLLTSSERHQNIASIALPVVTAVRYELERSQLADSDERSLEESTQLAIIGRDDIFTQQLLTEANSRGIEVLVWPTLSEAKRFLSQSSRPKQPLQTESTCKALPAIVLMSSMPEMDCESSSDRAQLFADFIALDSLLQVFVVSEKDSLSDRLEVTRRGGKFLCRQMTNSAQLIDLAWQSILPASNEETTILAMDDDPQFLSMLAPLLKPWGLKPITLSDAIDFWAVLKAVRPRLLLLDVEMPTVNGIDLCKMLRCDPAWSQLPILFVSAHADSETQHRAFAIGADDYICKPVRGRELATRILNRLERVRSLQSAQHV